MALANGLILAIGGLLIAIPIVLHFLMQPRPKVLPFPALRFVVPLQRTNKRQLRLKHLLLLILRVLAILAVAAALAQPSVVSGMFGNWLTLSGLAITGLLTLVLLLSAWFWMQPINRWLVGLLGLLLFAQLVGGGILASRLVANQDQPILGDRMAPVAAALVLDDSPRMAYRFENESLLARAQTLGTWLIEQFPFDSRVSVTFPHGDEAFFSVDANAAIQRLRTMEIDYRRSSIPASIASAVRLLADSELERKELYVITDLTRPSWSESSESLRSLLEAHPEISVYILDVGIESPKNLRLQRFSLVSSVLSPGDILEVDATLSSNGMSADQPVSLVIEQPDPRRPTRQDGKTLLSEEHWERTQPVHLEPDTPTISRFNVPLESLEGLTPGVHHGWLEIAGEDPLEIDNRRWFTFEVRPGWRTLVVHPPEVKPENFTISLADEFDIEVRPQGDLGSVSLGDYQLVAFLNPTPIGDSIWNELRRYVDGGGCVVLYLGHFAADQGMAAREFTTPAALDVLPARLTVISQSADALFLSPTDLSHPILAAFRQQATSVPWQRLPIYYYWGVEPPANEQGDPIQVITRYSNLRPALLERQIGQGRVILMTTPITEPPRPVDHEPWNALFFGGDIWPSWLLVVETARYLVQRDPGLLNFEVGQVAQLLDPATLTKREFWLYSPRNEEPLKLTADGHRLTYRFTQTPGNYRLRSLGEVDERLGFSANLDEQATDLTRVATEQLDQTLGAGRYQLAREQREIQRAQGVARIGQEFYPVLALLTVVILLLEFMTSTLFYRSSAVV